MPCDLRQQLEISTDRELAALLPPNDYTAREWAESEEGPVLSARTSSVSGRISLDMTPYIRGPLDAFSDPEVKRLFLCFGTQSGKTTFLQCIIGFIIDQQPGPAMFLRPTEWEATAFSKERMMPLIEDTPSLSRHVLGRFADKIKPLAYEFDRMTLSYAWSNSETSVRGRPIRYVIKDESSAYAPGASALADERCKTYWNAKIVETSTPSEDTDTIWRALGLRKKEGTKPEQAMVTASYEAKTQTSVYFYHVPCPRCGEMIRLEMDRLRWPEDAAIRDIEDKGWYECQVCGGRISDAEKLYAVQHGEWRTENPGGTWRGYHLNSLYAPWASCRFGAVAAQFIRARASGDYEVMKSFVNNWAALPYSLEDIGADTITSAGVEASKGAGTYMKNQLVEGVVALTVGVDVQEDCLYWVVMGWGARLLNGDDKPVEGEVKGPTLTHENTDIIESWTVSWGKSEDFAAFERDVLAREWAHPSGERLRIVAGLCDGRYRTAEVKAFCSRNREVMAVGFGEQTVKRSSSTSAIPFAVTSIDRDSKGKPLPNSRTGYRLNTTFFKQMFYSRANRTGAAVCHHLPGADDADERAYIRHLSSEMEVVERVRGSTETKRVWKVRRGFEANHWLDGSVYAEAIAYIRGLFGLEPGHKLIGVSTPAPDGGGDGKDGPKKRPRLFDRRKLFG